MFAIGTDSPEDAAALASDLGLTFPILSDPGLALSRKFGIVFHAPERDPLPVPAVYLVDGNGTLTFQYVHPDYTVRLHPDLLLAAASVDPARRPEGR